MNVIAKMRMRRRSHRGRKWLGGWGPQRRSRSAHQGKAFSGLPMNVLQGVSRESDGGHGVTDFGLSIELKRQWSVPVGNGASRKSDIPNEVGDTFSDVQRAEGADG